MAIQFADGLCGDQAVEFQVVTCANCGVLFMLSSTYVEKLRKSHNNFYCPNGHSLHYGQSACDKEKQKIEKELADHKRWVEQSAEHKRELWQKIDQLRKDNRDLRSVACPHCEKKVLNLERHLKKYHS